MKTLVEATHPGKKDNGVGGCFTRWANDGLCSGVATAAWLNSLGEDDEIFASLSKTTNGQVRHNWLRSSDHIREVQKGGR